MDAAVIASMARWPNVPDCYGWLHLNAQGQWLMGEQDELGDGQKPSVVEHEGLKNFINRNYVRTENGAWALQNGPQRVWVNLNLAPLIVRLHRGIATAHTGVVVNIEVVILSSDGVVYFNTDLGAAALESASMTAFSDGLQLKSAVTNMSIEQAVENTVQNKTQDLLAWQASTHHPVVSVLNCDSIHIQKTLGFTRKPRQQFERKLP